MGTRRTRAPRNQARRNQGSILIVSLILMTALIALGVGLLSTSSLHIAQAGNKMGRLQAQALALAGIEHGYYTILETPLTRGTLDAESLGDGEYQVTISDVASPRGNIEIVSVGIHDDTGVSVKLQAVAKVEVNLALQYPGQVVGELTIDGGSMTLGGTYAYGDKKSTDNDPAIEGTLRNVESSGVTLDAASFVSETCTMVTGGSTLTGDHSGYIYVDGDLTVAPPFSLTGSLFVSGDLTISPGTSVIFRQDREPGVLYVKGSVWVTGVDGYETSGAVLVEGNYWVQDTVTYGMGTTFVNGNADYVNVNAMVEHNPDLLRNRPTHVTGGPTRVEITETYRGVHFTD